MAKVNVIPAIVFHTFKNHFSTGLFTKVCNDTMSLLGRLEGDIKSKDGKWKCSAKGVLTSKEGHSLALPLNNPLTTLVRFGMQINEVADNMGVLKLSKDEKSVESHGIESELPLLVREWVKAEELALKTKQEEDKAKADKLTQEGKEAIKATEQQETGKAVKA